MNSIILTIAIVVGVLGIIGLVAQWYMAWMWVVLAVGVIGIIWGSLAKPTDQMKMKTR